MVALALSILACLGTTACNTNSETKAAHPIATAKRDEEPSPAKKSVDRLVSFAPSNTELIYAVGGEDKLVANSTYCNYPEEAKNKTRAGTFISAKYEMLTKLKPDLVLLVSGQEGLASQIDKHGFKTRTLPNNKILDIADNLEILGELCGAKERAHLLSTQFRESIVQLENILKNSKHPNVLFCVWTHPAVSVGGESFLHDVITICGAKNATDSFSASYPKLTDEKVITLKPEILILPNEARQEKIISRPPWSSLNAVKSKKFYYLPPAEEDQLSRPTLRILTGLHWLSTRLHPEKREDLDAWLKSNKHLILIRDKHIEG